MIKKMTFLTKTDDYQKMCDTNKNVIKMGVIIKGVYYTRIKVFDSSLIGINVFKNKQLIYHKTMTSWLMFC